MRELGDWALLSETWVPILVRKRKKSFVVIVAVGMEGNAALATPFHPQLSPVLSLEKGVLEHTQGNEDRGRMSSHLEPHENKAGRYISEDKKAT